MRRAPKWRVGRTGEAAPDYQYRVYRLVDGCAEVYQYADTRDEAASIAATANRDGVELPR